MKLSELMKDIIPDPAFVGDVMTDSMVLAVNVADTPATEPGDYIVVDDGITNQAGSLEAQNNDKNYLRRGKVSTKTGTSRTFAIEGDRIAGDQFQDAILAHKIKFGKGSTVVKEYVYFNSLTGVGEKGKVSITIEDDLAGEPSSNATFSAQLLGRGEPEEYTYAPKTA